MRGSVIRRERKDGSVVWCIKYIDADGRQRWETIGTSKRQAESALTSRLSASDQGLSESTGGPTLNDYVPTFVASKRRQVRMSTLTEYEGHLRNHLQPFFGLVPVSRIDLPLIQAFVDQWTGSPAMLKKVLATLSGLLGSAAVRGMGVSVDFSSLEVPRQRSGDIRVLSLPELYTLVEKIDERYAPDILFLGMTGVRRGEWLALRHSDINLDEGTAMVRNSVDRWGKIGPTKSGRARRVMLFDRAIDAYQWKLQVKDELGISDSPWAFPSPKGALIQPSNWYNRIWLPAIKRAGLPGLRIHDLRHTAASLMIEAGAPVHFVANQLGHEDPSFTLRVYAHWFQDRQQHIIDKVNVAYDERHPPVDLDGDPVNGNGKGTPWQS